MDNWKDRIDRASLAVKKEFESKGRNVISLDDIKEIAYALKHRLESNIELHANWFTEHWRNNSLLAFDNQGSNIFTTEGRNFILDEIFNSAGAVSADLYVGLFDQNVVPAAADTAAAKLGAAGDYGELQATTEMDEAARQAYEAAAAASSNVTNAANKATFTIAATRTIYGGFIVTDSDPTSTAGTLICAKAFTASRAVVDNDVLNILISITLTSS